jgi:hypothetical protein
MEFDDRALLRRFVGDRLSMARGKKFRDAMG